MINFLHSNKKGPNFKNIKESLQNIIKFTEELHKIIAEPQEIAKEILKEIDNININKNDLINNLAQKIKALNERVFEIFNTNYNLHLKKENENISSLINQINYIESSEIIYREIECTPFYEEINEFCENNNLNILEYERNISNSCFKNFYTFSFFTPNELIFNTEEKDKYLEDIKFIMKENINKLIISKSTKKFYLEEVLHSNKFNSIIKMKEIKKLGEIKLLQSIIKNFIGFKKIDYRGNSLCFNKSQNLKRGSEYYYPPDNWIALGINVSGKYEDNDWLTNKTETCKWSICYHPLKSLFLMRKILVEGLQPGESQFYQNYFDKRNPGKIIGKGVYLYQKIKMAEEKAEENLIDGKKYKLVFMTKVLTEKIKEPENINYWIVEPNYIRIYRVLIKEVF